MSAFTFAINVVEKLASNYSNSSVTNCNRVRDLGIRPNLPQSHGLPKNQIPRCLQNYPL